MISATVVAGFIAKNIDKIYEIAKKTYAHLDEEVQISLKLAYTGYLNNVSNKYSKTRSFFIRNQPVDLYEYYVPIGVRCDSNVIAEPNVDEIFSESLRIVVAGSGGSGKSVLIKHLFLDCIETGNYVPILIELRDLNDGETGLNEFIQSRLDDFGFNTSGNFIEKAKKSGHFCFFLDGYDEVTPGHKKKIIKELISLSNKYTSCPIVVSSRPDEIFNGLEDFSKFSIAPLDIKSASNLVGKLPFDADIKQRFITELQGSLFESHESFLSNPLLLSIMLLTYGENSEIPDKLSIFYNQAYEALFTRHDAYKGRYTRVRETQLDIQDFARVFAMFSLQTYEKRKFRMPRLACLRYIEKSYPSVDKKFKAEDYLSDLLSAACLMVEEGLEIAFSHRSFQEYFVALYISNAAPEIQEKLIERYWLNMRSDKVIHLLLEINPELVERVLLIPKIEKFFLDLGVKRSVGVTHAMRYIKKYYSRFESNYRSGIRATSGVPKLSSPITSLLTISAKCAGFSFMSVDEIKKVEKMAVERLGLENVFFSYKTSELTHNSPIMKELFEWGGIFSLDYLQKAYSGHKYLKNKHKHKMQNLESLLGF